MRHARYQFLGCWLVLAVVASGQSVVTWTSNTDQRWSRGANWSGGGRPDTNGEIAQFGSGSQLAPELNNNSYTVRGIRFSAGAGNYAVGDDNGSRLLKVGNSTSGFIENLSAANQAIAIATLQFQGDGTIRTTGAGQLAISSDLTGVNRDLTFSSASDITVSGDIKTGSGTLTKQGAASLNLSGANTYTGTTHLEAGAIVLQGSDVFADSGRVDIAAGASLRLNDYEDAVARLTGAGAIDFGDAGTGQLTLTSGVSFFSGDFTGSGRLVIGAGATLALGADFNNPDLDVILDGGTLRLAGHSLTLGELRVSDDAMVDFGWGGVDSVLDVAALGFDSSTVELTVLGWSNAADYFYSHTASIQGQPPLDQVRFAGWDASDTRWNSYDLQVTPIPEPSAYGAILIAALAGVAWGRRRA